MSQVIAIFGGSFNPPTIGHAMVVQWILWAGKADRVVLVPSKSHPLGKKHAPFEQRLALLEGMAADIDLSRITVSDVEDGWDGPVYTYDLLTYLKTVTPNDELRFIIGADILEETHKWHLWDKVREEFELIILGREGYPSPDDTPLIPGFSSTEVRELIAASGPVVPSPAAP